MEIPQELIGRCIKGDIKGEFELYLALYCFMMSICRRYLHQEEQARELLNLGYCRVLLNIKKYKPVAPFQFWVRRILINVIINEHKKENYHYGHHRYMDAYNEDEKYAAIILFDNTTVFLIYLHRLKIILKSLLKLHKSV
jgi:RNA polymerase sigma-70 factor (ECF subfamily)